MTVGIRGETKLIATLFWRLTIPDQYMTQHYGAVVVENSPDGHGLDVCCAYMGELIELSNGFLVGNSWDKCWIIPLFTETREEIKEHRCQRNE